MINNILGWIAGTVQSGDIDRVGLWTFFIAVIAWWQLSKGNKTTQADFIHRFTNDFFNYEARDLTMLFNNGLLKFKVRDISEKDKDELSKEFPYFEIDKKLLSKIRISNEAKEKLDKQEVYSAHEIDDNLLGHFESIANYERNGLINIQMVYETFSWYIEVAWENQEVKNYIQWLRSDGEEFYDGIEYVYKKIKSYGKAKERKEMVWIWKIKWSLLNH